MIKTGVPGPILPSWVKKLALIFKLGQNRINFIQFSRLGGRGGGGGGGDEYSRILLPFAIGGGGGNGSGGGVSDGGGGSGDAVISTTLYPAELTGLLLSSPS